MYLLFSSKYCKFCDKFREVLQTIHEDSFFEEILIDKVNKKRPDIVKNYNIKEVPTIIVDNKTYVGRQAFKWLNAKISAYNLGISSQDTRVNKPRERPINAFNNEQSTYLTIKNNDFCNSSNYLDLNDNRKIITLAEGEADRPKFTLPSNMLTNLKGLSETISDKNDSQPKMDIAEIRKKQEDDIKNNINRAY